MRRQTLSHIGPETESLERTYPLTATPTGLAGGRARSGSRTGCSARCRARPELRRGGDGGCDTAVECRKRCRRSGLHLGRVRQLRLGQIDPRTNALSLPGSRALPSAIAVGEGAVWVANSGDNTVSRMLPETATTVSTISVGRQPSGVAVADGIVWITDRGDNRHPLRRAIGVLANIAVGAAPTGSRSARTRSGWRTRTTGRSRRLIRPRGRSSRRSRRRASGRRLVSDGRVWVSVQAPA